MLFNRTAMKDFEEQISKTETPPGGVGLRHSKEEAEKGKLNGRGRSHLGSLCSCEVRMGLDRFGYAFHW